MRQVEPGAGGEKEKALFMSGLEPRSYGSIRGDYKSEQ